MNHYDTAIVETIRIINESQPDDDPIHLRVERLPNGYSIVAVTMHYARSDIADELLVQLSTPEQVARLLDAKVQQVRAMLQPAIDAMNPATPPDEDVDPNHKETPP